MATVWGSFRRWGVDNLKQHLPEILLEASRLLTLPDGSNRNIISLLDTADISQRSGRTRKEIDILALEQSIVPERYIRNMDALSMKDQITLLQSRVCIVGLGGLGGSVVETLARIGIGAMTVIDGDIFDESNLNRQVLSSEHNLSQTKTAAALEKILTVNSSILIQDYSEKMDEENAVHLLEHADIAVDCLDNIQARFILEKAAKKAGIPMVSAAVAGFSGQITAIFPEDRGLELVYGPEQSLSATRGAETTLGNLAFTVSLVASLECAEVVKILLNKDSDLRNQLLIVDLKEPTFERIRLL
ncbi:MAG: HesA/MoeB/ThiF family protein [Deltaproteobacteria bacterium]|nr:MAG: HesA/MoeB/ThiF family protein [Deltaproteobacteria bacterium]RLC14731.1 MAG: HesA/MoeB/ThiF family protein [Deltaproteobacteria bacterium]